MEEKTEMDRGMGQIPPDKHPGILKTAHKYRIDENDPTWILVNLVVESLGGIEKITNAGTKALREASVKVTEASAAVVKESREKAVLEITKLRGESVIEINEMKEKAKGDIVKALGITLTTEIGKAVDKLAMKSTAKKWLSIGLVSGGLLITVVNAWTDWSVWKKGEGTGLARGIPIIRSLNHFVSCDLPGWKIEKDKDGGETCYPHADKAGNQYGWRIR